MKIYTDYTTEKGEPIYTQEYVQSLRDADRKKPNKLLYLPQKGAQERMLSIDADIKIVGGSRGGPLHINTKVLTSKGYKPIKHIECGDIVFGIRNEEVKVVSKTRYEKLNCYGLLFDGGTEVVCSDDHIWDVSFVKEGDTIDGTIHTLLTAEIVSLLKKGYRVYAVNPERERLKGLAARRILSSRYVGKRDCCCIATDSIDSVFIIEDNIITHNSKSFSSLMEVLKDIQNPDFHALILRNEKDDLQSLVTDSYKLFAQEGTYNKSQNDMTWNFDKGGWLKFSYYAGIYADFKTRFQGRQYAYICIDEGTQCPYRKFKYLLTNNRNASGIRNRFWITCNPDPESWLRKFIDWWIDEDGYINPDKDGVVRYCFMDGDTPDSIYWGSTREEVYEQCSNIIDSLWNEDYASLGYNKLDMFIKSVTFIRADVSENIKLISTDPSYIANLAQQDEEQRMRDLKANWNWKAAGDDMVSFDDLEKLFENSEQIDDNIDRASADIAFTGGDNAVLWHWRGRHCVDLCVLRIDSKTLASAIQAKLNEWGVEQRNFTYDMQGIGQYLKGFFPEAVPFNNQAAPIAQDKKEADGIKYLYKDLKSQCAWLFYRAIKELTISIDPQLLERKYSGDGFKDVTLRKILQKERKSLRRDETGDDRGFRLLKKSVAKKYVGHSPDFWESWFFVVIFWISKKKHGSKKIKGLWMI